MDPWFKSNANQNSNARSSFRKRSLFGMLLAGFLKNIKITTWLIIINVIFFVFTLFTGLLSNCSGLCSYLVLQPRALFENYRVWTLVTSMFMHAGISHLFFNMFSLYFIGNFLEKIVGRKRFFWFYILAGIFAGLFFSILAYLFGFGIGARIFGDPSIVALGASGAIFGLLGVLAVLTPKAKVYLIGGPLIAIVLQVIFGSFVTNSILVSLINFILTLYVFISIFLIFSFSNKMRRLALPIRLSFWLLPMVAIIPLIIVGLFIPLPIGNMAHLGGLLAGIFYGFYLRRKYGKKIAALNRYFR
jgi:membrane associated rhomboid family serine protease